MRIIFLIMMGISILYAEFVKSGDIVKDGVTKLEWQDDVVSSQMKWEEAITHCEELSLGGYSDWRLPNINELKTIVDRSKAKPAVVSIFTHTVSDAYWSSTSYEHDKHSAWWIAFLSGYTYVDGKYLADYYVRCVRSGN